MLANFLHIGAAKCASTWLWKSYQEHPQICVPEKIDNCNFWVAEWFRGTDWYERTYFGHYNGEKCVGEFSNSYMLDEAAIQRIAKALPDVKLTCTLRNPIDRAFLQYAMLKRTLGESAKKITFDEVLGNYRWQYFRMWIEPGFYHLHLSRVLRHVPKERLLVLFYDDLERDERAFLRTAFEFLEVDPDVVPSTVGKVVGFPRPEEPDTSGGDLAKGMSAELRDNLRKIFREDITRLEELTRRDLSHWR